MRVLVLGGAGYIGSVVAAHLERAGHEITVADNLSTGNAWALSPAVRFVPVDVTDRAGLDQVIRNGYDAVLHFAGLSLAGASVRDPLGYLRANTSGAFNLLEAMRAHGIRRLVYSSTAAVYGDPGPDPVDESAPTRPTTPYGASKLAAEQAICFETEARGIGAVILRPFNVAGSHGALGEWHHPETHLIPLALQAAAGVRPVIPILGTDFPTPDGTGVRDFLHVSDLAQANVLALEATAEAGIKVCNISTGIGSSVRQIIELAGTVTGRPVPTSETPRRARDAAVVVGSPARAWRELGWKPSRTARDSVADTWAWMQLHLPASVVGAAAAG